MGLGSVAKGYAIVMIAFSVVSVAATLTVIIPLLCSPYLRRKPFTKIAGYICLTGLIDSFFRLLRLTNLDNTICCQLQAFSLFSAELSGVFCMTILTHFLYRIIVRSHRNINIAWGHCALVFGFPVFIAIFPLFLGLKFDTAWCNKAEAHDEYTEALTLLCSYGPTEYSSDWMREHSYLSSFFVNALWSYICVIIMIFEIMACLVMMLRLTGGDIRLVVTSYLLYPIGVILNKVNLLFQQFNTSVICQFPSCYQGLFFIFMFLAIQTDSISLKIPTILFCGTFLTGFVNSVIFWLVDQHARLWLQVKMDQFQYSLSLCTFFDDRDPVDDADDNSDNTGGFFVTMATSSSNTHNRANSSGINLNDDNVLHDSCMSLSSSSSDNNEAIGINGYI